MPEPVAKISIACSVNGKRVKAEVEPRTLLVEFLRDDLDLTGTHIGCDTSFCGACTVLVNGRSAKSCTLFAFQADAAEITTVEGLIQNGELHPVQQAFVDHHGLQCGFCTPGMMMTARWLLDHHPDPDEAEIREVISGQICRCTGYENIVRSIRWAAEHPGETA